jgi:hypothetical protein
MARNKKDYKKISEIYTLYMLIMQCHYYRFDLQNFAPKLLDSTIVPSPNMRLFLGVSKVPSLHLHTH